MQAPRDQARSATEPGQGEVFFSYAHADREQALPVVAALRGAGVSVFVDETDLDEFDEISSTLRNGLAAAKVFVAYYSTTYPTRPACQWELLSAFRAASTLGNPTHRLLVINPETSPEHIQPIELRDTMYATPATGEAAIPHAVQHIRNRVRSTPGVLGEALSTTRPVWRPTEHTGSERFVGRVAEFWKIHAALHATEHPIVNDTASADQAVIVGMGGVGKTLLAEQYARRFASFYPGGIYWFTAAASHTPNTIDTQELRAQHQQQLAAAFPQEPTTTDPALLREAIIHRLTQDGRACLWIVDDIPGNLPTDVRRELAAPHPVARTLFTTRWRGYDLPTIDVDVLSETEAYRLLTGTTPPQDPAEQAQAVELVRRLGCHALAIDLARGCLTEQPDRTYTELLHDLDDIQHGDIFHTVFAKLRRELPTGHDRDIAATFTRSLRHLDHRALTLLRIAATLAPAPMPTRLLAAITAAYHEQDLRTATDHTREDLATAATRSLIRTNGGHPPTWFLHALLARTLTLHPDTASTHPHIRTAALTATTALMQPVFTPGRLHLTDIAPHARALTEFLDSQEALALLDCLARYDYETGQPASAATQYERQWKENTQRLGPDHPNTLGSRNNLASAYESAGNLGLAIELHQATLTDCERVLGPNHPTTRIIRDNLDQSRSAEA